MPEVRESTAAEASPEEILRAAYPRRLPRARAVRWLSWIAWQSQGDRSFGWWDVPGWLGEDTLRWPRRVLAAVLIGTGFGLGLGLYNGGAVGASVGFTPCLDSAGEVAGILKEYLSALIEFSPLKDTFAAWAERLGSRTAPPDVADLVVPDPGKLRDAAAQENQEVAKTSVSDPAAVKTLLTGTGIAGAVGLVNQTRFLQENGTGPCDGCARPESGNDNGGPGHPDEPPVEPVP